MRLRFFAFASLFSLALASSQCAGGGPPIGNDAGDQPDAAIAIEAGSDSATKKDASTSDAAIDSPAMVDTDGSADAGLDGSADALAEAAGDAGVDLTTISGLVLWLEANKGVTTSGSDITTWADQSGKGNDATAGSATPTLASSSINSLPAAHFVATSQQYVTIADATSLQWGTGDYYVAVVAKFDNDPSGGVMTGIGAFYTKIGTGSGVVFFANDFDYVMSSATAGLSNIEDPTTSIGYGASYNDSTPRLYAVQRASASEYLRVGGSQVASGTSSVDVTESGTDVAIGLTLTTNYAALDGDIAEMVAVSGTLASADRDTIESYLKTKYGL